MFYRLLIFFIFTSIAENFRHEADLRRCSDDNKFGFINESCLNKTEGTDREKTLVTYELNKDKLNNETCDLILQIKPLTKIKWLVVMQITSETENLNSDSGIKFSVTIVGGKRFDDIFEEKEYRKLYPTLTYSTKDGDHNVAYKAGGDVFWRLPKEACDPTHIFSENDTWREYLRYEVDTTLLSIECKPPTSLLIIYNNSIRLADGMHCENKQFKYREINTPNIIEIPDEINVNVSCAVNFCSVCSSSDLHLKKCEDHVCTLPTSVDENDCKFAKCLDGTKWRMDDGSLKDGTVECKKKDGIYATGWFQTIDSKTKEISSASCSGLSTNAIKMSDRFGAATVFLLGFYLIISSRASKPSLLSTVLILVLVCSPAGAVRQPPPNNNPNLPAHAQHTVASAAKVRRPATRSVAPEITIGAAPWRSGGVASDSAMRRNRAIVLALQQQHAAPPTGSHAPPVNGIVLATPAVAAPPRLPAISERSDERSTGRGGGLRRHGNQGGVRTNLFGTTGGNIDDVQEMDEDYDDALLDETQPWHPDTDEADELAATIDGARPTATAVAEEQIAQLRRTNAEILRQLDVERTAAAAAREEADQARALLQRQQDAAARAVHGQTRNDGGGQRSDRGMDYERSPQGARPTQGVLAGSGAGAAAAAAGAAADGGVRRPVVNPHLRNGPVLVIGGDPMVHNNARPQANVNPHLHPPARVPLLPLPPGYHAPLMPSLPPNMQPQTSFDRLTALVSNIRNQLILRPNEDIANYCDSFRRFLRNSLLERTGVVWPTCSAVDGVIVGTRLHLDESSSNDLAIIIALNLDNVREVSRAADARGEIVNTFEMNSVAAAINLEREGILLDNPLRRVTFSFPDQAIPLGHLRAVNHGFPRNTLFITFGGHRQIAEFLVDVVNMIGAIGNHVDYYRMRVMAWFNDGNNVVIAATMLNGAYLASKQLCVTKR